MVKKAKSPWGLSIDEQQSEMLRVYEDKLNIDSTKWSLKSLTFDYPNKRIKESDQFPELSKSLKKGGNADDVKAQIKAALAKQDVIKKAADNFNDKLQAWKEILAKNPSKVPLEMARATVDYLASKKAKLLGKMEDQFQGDKSAIEGLFKDNRFTTELTNLGLTPPDKVKDGMIADLTKFKDAEIKKFAKLMDENINEIEKSIGNKLDRYALLHNRLKNEEGFLRKGESKLFSFLDSKQYITKKIRELAVKNKKKQPTSVGNQESDEFDGFELENLDGKIHSVVGRKITFNKDAAGKITQCNIELDSFFRINSWGTRRNLESLAQTMKASGAESIIMNINYTADPKHADELGRKAYEACLQAGYPQDKITIRVNGKDKLKTEKDAKGKITNQITELFNNEQQRFQNANSDAVKIAQKNENMVRDPLRKINRLAAMKNDIQNHKAAQQQAAAQPPAQQPTGGRPSLT
jgi:hypothetical protein